MPVVAAAADKPILYDVPVSNNGARCRLIMYWKRLEDAVEIRDPGTIGGLKSEEYLALNPQGKMPLLVLPDGLALPESEVISRYLCDAHADVGPSLLPAESPERRAVCALATRVHDQYVVPIQGVMYRGPMPIEQRAEGIAAIAKQLDVIEGVMKIYADEGPFVAGAEPSTADAALFPTYIFMDHCLTRHFGWRDGVFRDRPESERWWCAMRADTCGARVYDEVKGGLEKWGGRRSVRDGGRDRAREGRLVHVGVLALSRRVVSCRVVVVREASCCVCVLQYDTNVNDERRAA